MPQREPTNALINPKKKILMSQLLPDLRHTDLLLASCWEDVTQADNSLDFGAPNFSAGGNWNVFLSLPYKILNK